MPSKTELIAALCVNATEVALFYLIVSLFQ